MFKPSVVVLAAVLSGTALWSAFVDGSMNVTAALIRFLIAVPVAAVMVLIFGKVVGSYTDKVEARNRDAARSELLRRATESAAGPDTLGLEGTQSVR